MSSGTWQKNWDDSIKARQSAPMSSHDFGYAALQMEAKAMARDILQSEFHITDGEFKLSGSINRWKKRKEYTPPLVNIPKNKRGVNLPGQTIYERFRH